MNTKLFFTNQQITPSGSSARTRHASRGVAVLLFLLVTTLYSQFAFAQLPGQNQAVNLSWGGYIDTGVNFNVFFYRTCLQLKEYSFLL